MKLLTQFILLVVLTVISVTGFSQPFLPQESSSDSIERSAITGGERLLSQGEWLKAEAYFGEAIRVEPRKSLWHVYLAVALDKQEKTAAVHSALLKLIKLGVVEPFLVFPEKGVPGKLSFVNTEMFIDDTLGITRYLNAVKSQKKVTKVAEDIGNALEAYAKKRGIAIILDSSKFKEAHFFSEKSLDVTQDFINDYNTQHPEKPQSDFRSNQ